MDLTHFHRLILPADANHHGTLYAGTLLRLALEAGYATAWKHVGTEANLVLRRVLNVPLATADIVIVWVTIPWCMIAVWPVYKWVAVAQVPYFVWVSVATAVQVSILAMNWGT